MKKFWRKYKDDWSLNAWSNSIPDLLNAENFPIFLFSEADNSTLALLYDETFSNAMQVNLDETTLSVFAVERD